MKIDENATYQIMWDVATAVSRGELIALHSYIRNEQRSHINDFRTHIKKLEEVEQIKNEISKNMKINIRAEINEIESRKTIETMKWNAGSLKKNQENWYINMYNKMSKTVKFLRYFTIHTSYQISLPQFPGY